MVDYSKTWSPWLKSSRYTCTRGQSHSLIFVQGHPEWNRISGERYRTSGPLVRYCFIFLSLIRQPHALIIMSSQPKWGGGTYCFCCGSRRCCSLSALYLLKQWVDFDQTCTDTLLEGWEEVNRFWWPWPHFHGHTSTLKCSNFDQKILFAPHLFNQMTILVKLLIL